MNFIINFAILTPIILTNLLLLLININFKKYLTIFIPTLFISALLLHNIVNPFLILLTGSLSVLIIIIIIGIFGTNLSQNTYNVILATLGLLPWYFNTIASFFILLSIILIYIIYYSISKIYLQNIRKDSDKFLAFSVLIISLFSVIFI